MATPSQQLQNSKSFMNHIITVANGYTPASITDGTLLDPTIFTTVVQQTTIALNAFNLIVPNCPSHTITDNYVDPLWRLEQLVAAAGAAMFFGTGGSGVWNQLKGSIKFLPDGTVVMVEGPYMLMANLYATISDSRSWNDNNQH